MISTENNTPAALECNVCGEYMALECKVCGEYLAVITSGPNMGLYYAVADGPTDEGFWCRTKFTDHTPDLACQ